MSGGKTAGTENGVFLLEIYREKVKFYANMVNIFGRCCVFNTPAYFIKLSIAYESWILFREDTLPLSFLPPSGMRPNS